MTSHQQSKSSTPDRRIGDTIDIGGNYQWNAAHSKNLVQRFWHYTKKSAIDTLCPPTQDSLVLDVGCGSGVISAYLAEKYNVKVIAVDGNIKAIDFAKNSFLEVEFRHQLVDDEFNIGHSVDTIYCLELIEHIYIAQGKNLLDNFYRLLKPGGKLFLTTPNYKSAWPLIEKMMDLLHLAPNLAEDQHVTFYNPKTLANLVQASGFHVDLVRTNCFLAPWIAPFSQRLAHWLDEKELKLRIALGSIVVLVATKPE